MQTENKRSWIEHPIHPTLPAITYEILIFSAIILVALLTRFYDLGLRVMSHDESLHTYFSWLLYKGSGYQHTPMMHGPLQFHLLALSYFLFGVSDFTARIPAVLFNLATIWMVWYWRRYLGKTGALIAGILMVISPYMLFYGRYVRNEAYAGFSGILLLYAVLRYLESGHKRYLYMVTLALVIHFTAKETAFIYAAQILLFLGIYFIAQVTRKTWNGTARENKDYWGFLITLGLGTLLAGLGAVIGIRAGKTGTLTGSETAMPANPSLGTSPFAPTNTPISAGTVLLIIGLLVLAVAAFFLIRGYGWSRIRSDRSFGLLVLVFTMVMPMLAPFGVRWMKWTIPTTAPEISALTTTDIWHLGVFIVPFFLASIAIGQLWDAKFWWKAALLFWGIFIVLYTTFFTNSVGFFTGLIGSLGYWLVQQGVQRGSQPWYYYLLIQIPIYEFLPFLGSLLALYLGIKKINSDGKIAAELEIAKNQEKTGLQSGPEPEPSPEAVQFDPVTLNFPATFSLLVVWVVTSILAYSYAGERMPWLTYHITWPMILLTGWALGAIIEGTDWHTLRQRKPVLLIAIIVVFMSSVTAGMLAWLGPVPPFGGKDLMHLQATTEFLLPAMVALASAGGLIYFIRDWTGNDILRTLTLAFFFLLAVLTGRSAFRAAYIDYNDATEYLVYAHAATGVKDIISQATEISRRQTGGMDMLIAYDASSPDTGVSWPFVWYLRDFTNQRSFDAPTISLRDAPVIVVDQKNFSKIEPVVRDDYYEFNYIRMWWPNQDYFSLVTPHDPNTPFQDNYSCSGLLSFFKLFKDKDFSRLCSAFTNPKIRAGIVQIWLNRDYTEYAQATGHQDMTLTTWEPSDRMRMYIRKDVAAQTWDYGVGPSTQAAAADPYQGKKIDLSADLIFGIGGQANEQFNAPRGIAVAPDGSIYVADSRNNRIQHFAPDGAFVNAWSTEATNLNNQAPEGPNNEPWGVAVGPDGSVFVADTWNYRIEKYSPDGKLLKTWGHYGLAEDPESFWGPRGIAIDNQGHVYVTDTGNKRVVVFDSNGNYITQFGEAGLDPGQFDEPVGIAVDANGIVYVADTWNQRIQSFAPSADGTTFQPLKQWDVSGWYGQSLDNKPFIAVDNQGHLFATDPDGYRILEFTTDGEFVRTWGEYGLGENNFNLPSGIAVDTQGRVWVTDAGNNRVMRFTLP